jgi:hypothetical protein
MWRTPDRVGEPLYVIVPITNSQRFKARWKHALRAIQHFVDSGAVVYVVEAAFGEREHALDEFAPHKVFAHCPPIMDELAPNCRHDAVTRGQHRYIPLRTRTEIWLKENLINVGVSFLPPDWKYVAWLDADITFLRPNWVGECIHQLQHYDFLQMFSHAFDLDPDYTALPSNYRDGFMCAYVNGRPLPRRGYYYGQGQYDVWSGLAWACRRRAWDAVGGLIDFAIHGGGDWHMAFALVGKAMWGLRKDLHPAYIRRVLAWEKLCERHIRRNVGYMTGTVAHSWHGKKADRRYADRHALLSQLQFDPDTDLIYDSQNMLQLVDHGDERSIELRDNLRRHARERNEDSSDV